MNNHHAWLSGLQHSLDRERIRFYERDRSTHEAFKASCKFSRTSRIILQTLDDLCDELEKSRFPKSAQKKCLAQINEVKTQFRHINKTVRDVLKARTDTEDDSHAKTDLLKKHASTLMNDYGFARDHMQHIVAAMVKIVPAQPLPDGYDELRIPESLTDQAHGLAPLQSKPLVLQMAIDVTSLITQSAMAYKKALEKAEKNAQNTPSATAKPASPKQKTKESVQSHNWEQQILLEKLKKRQNEEMPLYYRNNEGKLTVEERYTVTESGGGGIALANANGERWGSKPKTSEYPHILASQFGQAYQDLKKVSAFLKERSDAPATDDYRAQVAEDIDTFLSTLATASKIIEKNVRDGSNKLYYQAPFVKRGKKAEYAVQTQKALEEIKALTDDFQKDTLPELLLLAKAHAPAIRRDENISLHDENHKMSGYEKMAQHALNAVDAINIYVQRSLMVFTQANGQLRR